MSCLKNTIRTFFRKIKEKVIYIYIFTKDSGTFKSFHSTTILVASQRSRKFHGMHVSMTEHSPDKIIYIQKAFLNIPKAYTEQTLFVKVC